MSGEGAEDGGRAEDVMPPAPSSRVQLEIEILTSDLTGNTPQRADPTEDAARCNVLLVTSDEALTRYLLLCLGVRPFIQALATQSVSAAVLAARQQSPQLLIADAARADVIRSLPDVPIILIVDEAIEPEERTYTRSARVSFMVRPFNARSLLSEVRRLIGDPPADAGADTSST